MSFHLPTLLAVWISIDVVIGLAFWAQYLRLGRVGGPGWWALACLMHGLGSVFLALRPVTPEWIGSPLSSLLFNVGFVMLWMGVRAYLGLPVRRILNAVAVLFVVQWLMYDFLILVIHSQPARQLLWAGTNIAVLWLILIDARKHRPRPVPNEFRALAGVLRLQMLIMASYAVASVPFGMPFMRAASLLTYCFLTAFLLIMLTFQCMLMLRLRDEAQAARAAQLQREADLQRLVDSLDVGVMEFQPDHTLWTMNRAAHRFLTSAGGGESAATVSYANWHMFDEHGRPLRSHEKPLERVLISGDAIRDIVVGLSLEGDARLRWALCSGYPETDGKGALCRVVLTFIDITETKTAQLKQDLLQAHRSTLSSAGPLLEVPTSPGPI